jgi:hypothetical protein
MNRPQNAVHHQPPPTDLTPPPRRARPPAVEATTRELVVNDPHPRLPIPRARRDRAGAPHLAASARRAVGLALSVAAAYGLVTPLPGNRQAASPDWSMS